MPVGRKAHSTEGGAGKTAGLYGDGGGLFLQVTARGSKS